MAELVKPQVFVVAATALNDVGLAAYLQSIGAGDWESDAPSGSEELIEVMGRLCYRSFGAELNPNVTKVTEGNAPYLANVLGHKHGSVFEHATVSFVFHNVSRVVTHELVRHRVGTAMSQESLRFVRLDKLLFWMPGAFSEHPEVQKRILTVLVALEELQVYMAEHFDLDSSKNFGFKKIITSAMRRIAPIGLATTIGWTANFRTIRHVIEMRTSRHAEEEIRLVFGLVAEQMLEMYPNIFCDMKSEFVGGYMEYTFENSKV